ncbi:MAG: hypothetical protein ACD_3C00001G0016 [uncultured bacterium (gcode 4)]|uniref:LamG-like jellyroll fold domain-containing protein n=1 Tax=uncultured bacterium (gcode 4) TaxID=1234023 RepID=K2GZD5_9BACT|nr:MAG: hypothetical protein ACD_3C00001G0016 [uncultured bacterium (gcode 4)]
MFNKKLIWKTAFTLVELIVVIVILAILATIAFLSFSSQSASARDSTRLADMNNITKWLSINYALAGKYPMPDSYVTLTASGTLAWYQWKAWISVLNMIKLSDWWRDPLDSWVFYTYSINSSQSKFQLMGFLEDWSNSALSLVPVSLALDYSKRHPITRWDNIWILLSSWSLDPVENKISNSFTGVDLVNVWTWIYVTKLSANETINDTILSKYSTWLIAYWGMDVQGWNILADLSWNWNNWTLSWTTSSAGKIWNARIFNWTTEVASTTSPLISGTMDFTISAWINNSSKKTVNYIAWNYNLWNSPGVEFYIYKNKLTAWMWTWFTTGETSLWLNQWHFVTLTRKNFKVNLYVNGILNASSINNANIGSAKNFSIGNGSDYTSEAFLGTIDEVRVYNRAISDTEVLASYNANK